MQGGAAEPVGCRVVVGSKAAEVMAVQGEPKGQRQKEMGRIEVEVHRGSRQPMTIGPRIYVAERDS